MEQLRKEAGEILSIHSLLQGLLIPRQVLIIGILYLMAVNGIYICHTVVDMVFT
jgi:hypothetical protein